MTGKLRFDEAFFRQVIGLLPKVMISYFDTRLRYVVIEGSLVSDLGLQSSELEGTEVGGMQSGPAIERVRRACEDTIHGAHVFFEVEFKGRYLECNASPHIEDGEIVGGLLVTRDITHRRRNDIQVQMLARTDPLTGIATRARFHSAARTAARQHSTFAVAIIDLDGFKAVNDTRGHAEGDLCLRAAAGAIARCVRDGDTVARLGGDEFGIVLPNVSGREIVDSVVARVKAAVFTLPFGITASVGTAFYPEDARELDALVHFADAAMYRNKVASRDSGDINEKAR